MDDLMNFDLEPGRSSIIKVFGVGGGGSNAVNHMYRKGIKDVDYVICNTDAQALNSSPVAVKIQLGENLTEGRGAGSKPEIGRQAALESLEEIKDILSGNTRMVFITAGMGGGTGTGAAPVIAKAAKEMGILTVAIVTMPFKFEGAIRINQAIDGINEIKDYVDSLLVINNDKLREIYGNLPVSQTFSRADDVLAIAAKGIAEIITVHGYVNVDFADVETVMSNSGVALMGSATATGDNRARKAIEGALASPLLNNNEITGAKSVLLNITSGSDEVTMDEISEITDYVITAASRDTTMIWGMSIDESIGENICVTIIATGFKMNSIPELYIAKRPLSKVPLNDRKQEDEIVSTDFQVTRNARQSVLHFPDNEGGDQFMVINEGEGLSEQERERRMAERVKNIKTTHEKLKEAGYVGSSPDEQIEELENVPAFVRKKLQLDQNKLSENEEVSRYRLSDDGENNPPKLSQDNAYLHDNVD